MNMNTNMNVYLYMYIWLVVSTPLKNINQLGLLFPWCMEKENMFLPNHQPDMYMCMCMHMYMWVSVYLYEYVCMYVGT